MASHVLQLHPRATGLAEETVGAHQADSELVLYGGWVRPPASISPDAHHPPVLPVHPQVLDGPRGARHSVQIRRDQSVQ